MWLLSFIWYIQNYVWYPLTEKCVQGQGESWYTEIVFCGHRLRVHICSGSKCVQKKIVVVIKSVGQNLDYGSQTAPEKPNNWNLSFWVFDNRQHCDKVIMMAFKSIKSTNYANSYIILMGVFFWCFGSSGKNNIFVWRTMNNFNNFNQFSHSDLRKKHFAHGRKTRR